MKYLKNRKVVRWIIIINFIMVVALAPLMTSRKVYAYVKATGLDEPLGWMISSWFGGSTILASGIFIWRLIKRFGRAEAEGPETKDISIDGGLLVAWWAFLLLIFVYAFITGLGG